MVYLEWWDKTHTNFKNLENNSFDYVALKRRKKDLYVLIKKNPK